MAKKTKKAAAATGEQLVAKIRDSASQIWLAGLGAFSKAQQEGTGLFNALVKEGEAVQKRTKQAAGETVADLRGRVAEIRENATGAWDKLEHVFEQRVARALHSLNVPTKKDIDHLSRRVAELTSVANKLSTTMSHEKHH
ncbi:MAG TPA: phasin family protein [Pseudolabrys sp.]|nr:phasin family protein [Pseudolabrys sp.]